MDTEKLECMLNQDPTVNCPYCTMTPLPEDLEQHVATAHPEKWEEWWRDTTRKLRRLI